jgi:hypothetical protein
VTTPTAPADDESTPATTRREFVRVSARGFTVIRNIFVQDRIGGKGVGSTLGRLVEARQPRALLAYLLLLMSWSAIDKMPEPLEAAVWARALSPNPPADPIPASAMTRVWNKLVELGLITRQREARLVRIGPRREDGKRDYSRPRPDESKSVREKFFVLPDVFWTDDWHETLSMPGIAMLLILLEETTGRDEVHLAYERAPAWYGISPKTMQNGLDELRRLGLATMREEWVRSDFSKIGKKQRRYYQLTGPFSREERKKLQDTAKRATRRRATKAVHRRAPAKKASSGSSS